MNGRIIPLTLPKWGLIMTEGTLVAWRVDVGARLEVDTVIADIESEKIVNELAAHEAGVLRRQLIKAGDTCDVGTLIGLATAGEVSEADLDAYVAQTAGGSAPLHAPPTASAPLKSANHAAPTSTASRDERPGAAVVRIPPGLRREGVPRDVTATHYAKALAEQWIVDLSAVSGTGSGGQVTKSDLLEAIAGAGGSFDAALARAADRMVPAPDPGRPATPVARRLAARSGIALSAIALRPGATRIRKADVLAASKGLAPAAQATAAPLVDASATGDFEERTLTATRRVIAQRLAQSKQVAPHFRLVADVRADGLLALGKKISEESGMKVSLNDLLIKAAAQALVAIPGVNIHVLGDRVRYFKDANVAIAVATDGGLITPVVRGADRKGIAAIAAETKELGNKAREGRLSADEIAGGTFTVSNLGMFGIRQFDAIINPPQGAILAVGAAQRRRIFLDDGAEVVATVLTATLACDHRAIDGVLGARFLQAFKGFVESPQALA